MAEENLNLYNDTQENNITGQVEEEWLTTTLRPGLFMFK